MQKLNKKELLSLIQAVFPRLSGDKNLAIIVDVPRTDKDDTPRWKTRRALAYEWWQTLKSGCGELDLENVNLIAYASVDSNNADLPENGFSLTGEVPEVSTELKDNQIDFSEIFSNHQLFLAPTQYSTTAPMKVNAKKYGFRAATMPGFAPSMIPALRIDYGLVNERCHIMKNKLDPAVGAEVKFLIKSRDFPAPTMRLILLPMN